MELSNRNQAVWLARGEALGAFLKQLLLALGAFVGPLRDVSFTHRRLLKRP